MSDYIMNRESLKRHCEAVCKKFKDVPTSGTYGEHRLVLDLLEQTEWIPCTERLPEKEYENYLVSTGDGEVDIGSYGSEKGWSMCDADGFYYPRHRGIEIVAWMPLPEPYKAEKARKQNEQNSV